MQLNIKQLYIRLTSSSLGRSTGVYTISGFINAAIPLLLLPVLTQKLSPADYGLVAMFQLAVSVVYPFIGINLEGSITRKYYDKDAEDFPSYVGSCFILFIASSIILTLMYLIFKNYIYNLTLIPNDWIKYILLVAGCQFITTVILNLFRVKVQPFKYGVFQISQSLFNIILTIVFVIFLNEKWQGRLKAQIIAGIVFAFVSIIILFNNKQIKFNINKKDIHHALKFGAPLIPHAIGGMLFTAIDRFFLSNLVGLEQTGNYTVAFQIGTVISLFTLAFNNAFVPWLFENLAKDDLVIKRKIVKFTYLYFVLLAVGATILWLFFPLIVSIFVSHKFKTVNTYSAFIIFGFVFQGMYYMVTNYIIFAQKTYILAIITISVGLFKLLITYFSIIWFGPVGAAISYCITFFIYFILNWILSIRVYKMPWVSAFSN
jgi:O-antigen/teichoic acid export membrane protein